jgi:hypothetical protein
MACLYRHIRLDKNEPFYIGIGMTLIRPYEKRSRSKHWMNIAKKGYDVEVLFEDIEWDEACKKEIEFIELYGRVIDKNGGTLVNLTKGGEGTLGYQNGNYFWKGRNIYPHMREAIIKSAKSRVNEKNPFYGKKHTQETKNKIGKANKGKLSGGKSPNAKKVINLVTNKIYDCVRDASKDSNISYDVMKTNCQREINNWKYLSKEPKTEE